MTLIGGAVTFVSLQHYFIWESVTCIFKNTAWAYSIKLIQEGSTYYNSALANLFIFKQKSKLF